MIAREEKCGYGTAERPQLLRFQVTFADGQHFPDAASQVTSKYDFSELNFQWESFRESAKYLDFHDKVRSLSVEIASRIDDVPEWQPGFPLVTPDPSPATSYPLERLIE